MELPSTEVTGLVVPSAELIGIAFCLVFSAIFSGSETALTSLGRARLERIMNESRLAASALRLWNDKPNEVLTSILIGNNILNTLASALATSAAESALSGISSQNALLQPIPIAVGTMTFLLLTFGEITPKVLARGFAERLVVPAMFLLRPVYYLFLPISLFYVWLSGIVVRLVGGAPGNANVSEQEIEFMVQLGSEEGSISSDRGALLEAVFEFTDTSAREVMVARIDICAVPSDTSLEETIEIALQRGHSRVPVFDGNLDEIVGIAHVKDVVRAIRANRGDPKRTVIRDHVRDAYFIPESKGILPLMREMQANRFHMAVVVDEFGSVTGLVTLEDIIEEFFGEIWDEHDGVIDEPVLRMNEEGDDVYRVDARVSVYDVGELFGMDLPDDFDFDTIGGFIAKETGVVAKTGTVITHWGLRFEVLEADRRRIRTVKVERASDDADSIYVPEEDEPSSGS